MQLKTVVPSGLTLPSTPADLSPTAGEPPVATAGDKPTSAGEKPTTPTGTVDHARPSPRTPLALLPQQSSWPFESTAHVLPRAAKFSSPPAAIWTAPVRPCTSTGVSQQA